MEWPRENQKARRGVRIRWRPEILGVKEGQVSRIYPHVQENPNVDRREET